LYYNSCFNPGVDASEAQSIIRMYRREVGESPKLQKLSLMLSLVAPGNIKKVLERMRSIQIMRVVDAFRSLNAVDVHIAYGEISSAFR
jgi:hypothetical protein